jgi:dinuclear metal center YbgI/SA1388 family protein
MHRDELARYLDGLLDAPRFRDYCPNGLQVEGRPEIGRIVSGVTASLQLVEAAIEANADAVLVHHGYFWRGEDRLATLLAHDINLFAYHLPLDAHPEVGNNAQLALRLGLVEASRTGEQNLISVGKATAGAASLGEFARHVEKQLDRAPLLLGDPSRALSALAWCTGAAQGFFEQVLGSGVDLYLTGEISEQQVHLSRESGVAFLACGHHATERFGVQALGRRLAQDLGLHHQFIDIPNPV